MSWCSAKATFAICWQNIAPTTMEHVRTLRLTKDSPLHRPVQAVGRIASSRGSAVFHRQSVRMA